MITAYIDPGAGSLLIQAILASVLAIPFLLRSRVAELIARMRSRKTPGDGAER